MKGTGAKRNVFPGSCVSTGGEVPGCPGGVGACGGERARGRDAGKSRQRGHSQHRPATRVESRQQ